MEEDIRRMKIEREVIGKESYIMIEEKKVWEVDKEIEWVRRIEFENKFLIEEKKRKEDVEGNRKIREEIGKVKVEKGEM